MTGRHGPVRRIAFGLVLAGVAVAGCVPSAPTPTFAPRTPRPDPSAAASPAARAAGTLVAAVPAGPVDLLPPVGDPVSAILADALYDTLYRLGPDLAPEPLLAADLPALSEDGRTWTIPLAGTGLAFADATPLVAADVAFSLGLAVSPACPYGRTICDAAARITSVTETSATEIVLTLAEPWQPLLGTVLGQVPIVSELAVRQGVDAILAASEGSDPAGPEEQLDRIADALTATACAGSPAPFGCRLEDHAGRLERTLTEAGVTLPSREAYRDRAGAIAGDRYAADLLDRVAALGRLLGGDAEDRYAAGLPLLDPLARPLGSGPFRIAGVIPGARIDLVANERHVEGTPPIARIELRTVADPEEAAVLLATGVVDWIPVVGAGERAALAASPGVRIAERPEPLQRAILFNVRPGRPYADPRVREAFERCLDIAAIATKATEGRAAVVHAWGAPGSWGFPAAPPPPADPAAAAALLDAAGWVPGPDGIRVQDGVRLASAIAIRSGRGDLVTFAREAAAALRACGIELRIDELDLTGTALLEALQWPNAFDTLLVTREGGVDPDEDLVAFASTGVTSAEQPVGPNAGGYADAELDTRIDLARRTPGQAARAALYAEAAAILDAARPVLPLWYETATAAIAERVRDGDGPVDPALPRYHGRIGRWTLAPAP
ncbi:MAG: ABC transporter substrate-binding protein [Chloroflexota bacterium]